MKTLRAISEMRLAVSARPAGQNVGLVPTMGWFHEGHLSLMRRARSECGFVVVSLFVNPTQFNDAADLAAYPRDEARDAELAASVGVDAMFVPSVAEMYPTGFTTSVVVAGLSEPLEGVQRGASHFRGVATVVTKLLNIVVPDVAYFGQKDAQQALVIRRLARDLDLPVRIEVCETVREPDGLAMSSRNVRLHDEDRRRAVALSRGLEAAREAVSRGERDAGAVERAGREVMREHGVEAEYFAAVSAATLAPFDGEPLHGDVLVAVAARLGAVRLIDNVLLRITS